MPSVNRPWECVGQKLATIRIKLLGMCNVHEHHQCHILQYTYLGTYGITWVLLT